MREIKFRAWDKESREWIHFEMNWMFDIKEGVTTFIPALKPNFISNYDEENVVLMQFTGLKDKNDKEIYEGDIIKGYLTLENNDVYDFQDIIEYHYCSFECPNNADFPLDAYTELEVIGNIYENSELLKGD